MEKQNQTFDETQNIPTLHLMGDQRESFYQLGLKDKDGYDEITNHLQQLLFPNSKTIKLLTQSLLEFYGARASVSYQSPLPWLEAYAEGLGKDPDEVLKGQLVPELLAAIHKWLPSGAVPLLGCSSAFTLDKEKNIHHSRALDFPLNGSFDNHERIIRYQYDHYPMVWSLGSAGLPLPSITAMNSEGVTLALHQKFSDTFYAKATPIFDITSKILFEGTSRKSVLKILKNSQSMTLWGLYIGLPGGSVLEVDICGEDFSYREYDLKPGEIKYFNNIALNPEYQENLRTPQGMHHQNLMRVECAQKKLNRLQSQNPERIYNSQDLVKFLSKPLEQKDSKDWRMDTITPTALHIATMVPAKGEANYIPGKAPKVYTGEIRAIENIWGKTNEKTHKRAAAQYDKTLRAGFRRFGKALASYDLKDYPQSFHQYQMGIDEFEGFPQREVMSFFLAVGKYIHAPNRGELEVVFSEFKELEGRIPPYLNEHLLLFLMRLEKILIGKTFVNSKDFKEQRMIQIYQFEAKLPKFILKNLRPLIYPRPDALDVIYGYFK